MQRDKWEFTYTVLEVLAGAKIKLAHHEERLGWWLAKKEEVIEKVKAEGIEVDETLANYLSDKGRYTQVRVRNDLAADLQECVSKVREHKGKTDEYKSWVEILAHTKSSDDLDLTHADWHYFFSKYGNEQDDEKDDV